jgi:hypothetical protein
LRRLHRRRHSHQEASAKADVTIGEYSIAFDPPAYLPTAGRLDAVWRRPVDFTVVAK